MKLTFDDVLIEPKFNTVASRKDVDISSYVMHGELTLPVISSNMDTVTEYAMMMAMKRAGGIGCLHRFSSTEDLIDMIESRKKNLDNNYIASVGLSDYEFERAKALYKAGCLKFCIDVAHGASQAVCDMLDRLHHEFMDDHISIMIGNFATGDSLLKFVENSEFMPDAVKVGIGPGSACTTRTKTGCGFPQLSAIQDVSKMARDMDIAVIADGGMKTPGDIAKAIAAGADAVMLGGMLAGTDESPGKKKIITLHEAERLGLSNNAVKIYRGSASKESYKDQGKDESWRTAEGESFFVPQKGPVDLILKDIEGGLRSALTYVGARNLEEFRENANFIQVSSSARIENGAHGKR